MYYVCVNKKIRETERDGKGEHFIIKILALSLGLGLVLVELEACTNWVFFA